MEDGASTRHFSIILAINWHQYYWKNLNKRPKCTHKLVFSEHLTFMAIIRLFCKCRNTDQLYSNLIQELSKIDLVEALTIISIWCGAHQMHNTLLEADQTICVTNREWWLVILFFPSDDILISLLRHRLENVLRNLMIMLNMFFQQCGAWTWGRWPGEGSWDHHSSKCTCIDWKNTIHSACCCR
jgi:hypothetical protein